jgi:hypothetical protein
MKILIPAVLAVACAQPVLGCDLCSVYAATEAQGGSGIGFFGGVAGQFTHFGTLQDEGRKVPNPGGQQNQYIDSLVSQVFAGYNFTERFGLQLNLPVIYRAYSRPRPETFVPFEHGNDLGIGDASLIANFLGYQKLSENFTFNWTILGGLKFPTGDSKHLSDPEVEGSGIGGHDLALGSGSVDGVVGTGLSARWKRLFLTGGLQYAARTEGDFGHQYANDLTWSGGPGVYLALTHNYSLAFQALFSGETKEKDTVNGVPDGDSAETIYYAGPQINFTWRSKLSAQVGVDFPLSIENTGLQAVPDYRVRAAFTWRF